MTDASSANENSDSPPLVSCVMVTADRPRLCRRAVRCYLRQTYPNKELVVVDDGQVDLGPVLSELPSDEVRYLKLPAHPENVLGRLRNLSLQHATGQFVVQWDDDDWYHEDRIARQVETLKSGVDACALSGTLTHLDTRQYFEHPYLGFIPEGIPGSIMHVRDDSIQYPVVRRGEDTAYLQLWLDRSYARLPRDEAHLFIRCYHGANTWEIDHFERRMRNSALDLVAYAWHKYVRRDLFKHPRFQLDVAARDAFALYLEDSYELGIFQRA